MPDSDIGDNDKEGGVMSTLLEAAPWVLGSGGLGALGGYFMTKGDKNESASDRSKRRLKNALVMGLMGTGVGAGAFAGYKSLKGAAPEFEDDVNNALVNSISEYGAPVIGTGIDVVGSPVGTLSLASAAGAYGMKKGWQHAAKEIEKDVSAIQSTFGGSKASGQLQDLKGIRNVIESVDGDLDEAVKKLNTKTITRRNGKKGTAAIINTPEEIGMAARRLKNIKAPMLSKLKGLGKGGLIGSAVTVGGIQGVHGLKHLLSSIFSEDEE